MMAEIEKMYSVYIWTKQRIDKQTKHAARLRKTKDSKPDLRVYLVFDFSQL